MQVMLFYKMKGGNREGRDVHKTIIVVWNLLSLFKILGRLLKNYLQFIVIVLLWFSHSLSLALYIKRSPVINLNSSSPLLSLCNHPVHISVNECLLLLLAALTFSSTCYAVMNQTLLWVHCSMLKTNQGSYLKAQLSWVDHNVSLLADSIFLPSSSHLHICSLYALWLTDY